MKEYLNIMIIESESRQLPSDNAFAPVATIRSTTQEDVLIASPVPWYGHDISGSPKAKVTFPPLSTFASIAVEPGKVFLEGWSDGENLFEMPLVHGEDDPDEDEDAPVDTDDLIPVIELDFIENLIIDLEEAGDELFSGGDVEDLNDIVIDVLDDDEQDVSLFFQIVDGCLELRLSSAGKETVFDTIESDERLNAFISALNTAVAMCLGM